MKNAVKKKPSVKEKRKLRWKQKRVFFLFYLFKNFRLKLLRVFYIFFRYFITSFYYLKYIWQWWQAVFYTLTKISRLRNRYLFIMILFFWMYKTYSFFDDYNSLFYFFGTKLFLFSFIFYLFRVIFYYNFPSFQNTIVRYWDSFWTR